MAESSYSLKLVEIDRLNLRGAVEAHLEAFKDRPSGKLGRRYGERFLLWFADYPQGLALAVTEGDTVHGYVVGAPVGYQRKLNRDLFFTVLGATILKPWLLFTAGYVRIVYNKLKSMLGMKVIQDEPADYPQPVISLVGIGVSASSRGKGVGRMLMDEFERRSREMGMKTMRLSVHRDNTAANKLYRKSGWNMHDTGRRVVYYFKIIR